MFVINLHALILIIYHMKFSKFTFLLTGLCVLSFFSEVKGQRGVVDIGYAATSLKAPGTVFLHADNDNTNNNKLDDFISFIIGGEGPGETSHEAAKDELARFSRKSANNRKFQLFQNTHLSFGTTAGQRAIALWEDKDLENWYGLGMDLGKMRLQVGPQATFGFFAGSQNEIMTVKSNGNVGIGYPDPQQKLAVNGSGYFRELLIENGGLTVNGNVTGVDGTFSGNVTANNFSVINDNSFFGLGAGSNNTGNYNSFFGTNTGANNTSGTANTFIGINAGQVNTTGNYNIFIGDRAGDSNTEGSDNVFIGRFTGLRNVKGSNNVFIGNYAGEKSGGQNNTLRIANNTDKTLIIGDFEYNQVGVGFHDLAKLDEHLGADEAGLAINGGLYAEKIFVKEIVHNEDIRHEHSLTFGGQQDSKGVLWSNELWQGSYSRLDVYDGKLHAMTDESFHITDINITDGTPGSTRFYVDTNNGNVGIGYEGDDVDEKLKVNGSGFFYGNLEVEGGQITLAGGDNQNNYLSVKSKVIEGGSQEAESRFWTHTDGKLYVQNSKGIELGDINSVNGHLSILSDGRVGVGTSNPMAGVSLSVDGGIAIRRKSGSRVKNTQVVKGTDRFQLVVEDGIATERYLWIHPCMWDNDPNNDGGCPEDWGDYVFEKDYPLLSLNELSQYVDEFKHLPGVPSAESIMQDGYEMHEMNKNFVIKIEELTLYTLQQEQKLKEQAEKLKKQTKEMERLKEVADKYEALSQEIEALKKAINK